MSASETLEIKDKATKVLKDVKSSTDSLRAAHESLTKSLHKTKDSFSSVTGFAHAFKASVDRLRTSVKDLGKESKHSSEGFKDFFKAQVAFELLKKGTQLVIDGTKELYDNFVSLDAAEHVFALKDGDEGKRRLDALLDRTKALGIADEDAKKLATALGQAFPTKDAQRLSDIILDMRANFPLETLDELSAKFVDLSNRSVVGQRQVRDLNQFFGKFGAIDEVAKATGKSAAAIAAQLKAGTLPAKSLAMGLEQAQKDIAGTQKTGEAATQRSAHSLEAQVGHLKESIGEIGDTFASDLFGGPGLAEGIKSAADSLDAFTRREDVKKFINDVAGALRSLALTVAPLIPKAFEAIISVVNKVVSAYKWLTSGSEGANATLAALAGGGIAALAIALYTLVPPLVVVAADAIAAGIAFIVASLPVLAIVAAVALLAVGLYELVAHWDDVTAALKRWASAAWGAIKGVWDSMVNFVAKMVGFGVDLVSGLVDGIKSMASAPVKAITSIGDGIASAFKKALGIASPSKVMMEMGVDTSLGAAKGIDKGATAVGRSSESMALKARSPADDAGGGAAGKAPGGFGGDINVVVHNNFSGDTGVGSGGLTPDVISATMRRTIEDVMTQALSRMQQQGAF